jgi:hypothetical protein
VRAVVVAAAAERTRLLQLHADWALVRVRLTARTSNLALAPPAC